MSSSSFIDHADAVRGSLRQFVENYLRHRNPEHLVGEFLHEDGWRNKQFGLAGTCFVTHIAEREKLSVKSADTWCIIEQGLSCPPDTRDARMTALLKDVPRVPNKAVLIAFVPESYRSVEPALREMFAQAEPNGLFRSVLDDGDAVPDPIVTAYVFQMMRFAGRDKAFQTDIQKAIPELKRQIRQSNLSLYERLFVSTTVCLFDFAGSIETHRKIVSELYSSSEDWRHAFSADSPYLDHRFSDPAHTRGPAHRYLKIPIGYIVLSAIYITIGDEKRFLNFRPVRRLLGDIRPPFEGHVGRDLSKAGVYYVWFIWVVLHPGLFFSVPVQGYGRRALDEVSFFKKDLTMVGIAVVILGVVGVLGSAAFAYLTMKNGTSELGNLFGAIGMTFTAILSLMGTRKR